MHLNLISRILFMLCFPHLFFSAVQLHHIFPIAFLFSTTFIIIAKLTNSPHEQFRRFSIPYSPDFRYKIYIFILCKCRHRLYGEVRVNPNRVLNRLKLTLQIPQPSYWVLQFYFNQLKSFHPYPNQRPSTDQLYSGFRILYLTAVDPSTLTPTIVGN